MKILIPVPDRDYYAWQVLVQIANFRTFGYEADTTYLVSYKKRISPNVERIMKDPTMKCKFIPIEDKRVNPRYPPGMAIYTAREYFKINPEYGKGAFMYADPDIIFSRRMDFTPYLNDDIWYGSNVAGYIGAPYIKGKGDALLTEMCNIVDLPRDMVENTTNDCIGAQYILKNVDWTYWDEVYNISEILYQHLKNTSSKYNPKHPIQAWTADMWVRLWLAWKKGITTKATGELKTFCWANHKIANWHKYPIYHNAGATKAVGDEHFKKVEYSTPFKQDIKVSPDSASSKFVEWIKKTERIFPNLIW